MVYSIYPLYVFNGEKFLFMSHKSVDSVISENNFLQFVLHFWYTEPALVLALRGIDAFRRLGAVIPQAQPGKGKDPHIDYVMSQNAEESYGFARAFFTDKEIFSDPSARHLLMYLPQIRHHIQGFGSRYCNKTWLPKMHLQKPSIGSILLSFRWE